MAVAQYYHQRTKYDPRTIASQSRPLGWQNQPRPYKEYKIGPTLDLKSFAANSRGDRLARLLLYSYGITAQIEGPGSTPIYLRSAPSAGGLYPAELYVISRGSVDLKAGIYNYQVISHSLQQVWAADVWPQLQAASFGQPIWRETDLALVVSAVFYRSAWRYSDRAYRRICLDTGHLLGNLALVGEWLGLIPHFLAGFADRLVNDVLYFDPDQEGCMVLIPLSDRQQSQSSSYLSALPSPTTITYPELPDGQLLNQLHQSSGISPGAMPTVPTGVRVDKYSFPFCTKVSTVTTPISWGQDLEYLAKSLIQRRSTREYTGRAIAFNQLQALIDFAYHPENYLDQGLAPLTDYFDLSLIETFIAVSGVEGLESGCYYYAPQAQELRQTRFKNFRTELHYLCLGQNLGRDAAAVIFHTADLDQAVEKWGDRAYRYLHLDAGQIGQRINLAATRLGLGASGIGGFFDDQVNEVLGIPAQEAVIYITTIGQPSNIT